LLDFLELGHISKYFLFYFEIKGNGSLFGNLGIPPQIWGFGITLDSGSQEPFFELHLKWSISSFTCGDKKTLGLRQRGHSGFLGQSAFIGLIVFHISFFRILGRLGKITFQKFPAFLGLVFQVLFIKHPKKTLLFFRLAFYLSRSWILPGP